MKIASIDASKLYKGQAVPADLAWEHFVNRKPDKLQDWIEEHGTEEAAKLARLQYVLLQVRDWLDRDRRELELPPLVMGREASAATGNASEGSCNESSGT